VNEVTINRQAERQTPEALGDPYSLDYQRDPHAEGGARRGCAGYCGVAPDNEE
jgi:hypothetical protein